MHIRLAEERDILSIVNLGKILMNEHYSRDPDYYQLEDNFEGEFILWVKSQLNSQYQFIMVSEDENGQVTGFIAGFLKSLFSWFKIKSVGHISYLMIEEKYRKTGVGRLLENEAINWFKAKNIKYVELYVNEDNKTGCLVWDAYGYTPFKRFLRKVI